MITQKEWRDVVGYEGYYVVNANGVVKSVDRFVPQYGGLRHVPEKIKASYLNAKGYPCVTLCKNKKSRCMPKHIILAKAVIPNPDNTPVAIDAKMTLKSSPLLRSQYGATPIHSRM